MKNNMVSIPSQQGYIQKRLAAFLVFGYLSVLVLYTGVSILLSFHGITDKLFNALFLGSHYLIALGAIIWIAALILIVRSFKHKHDDDSQKKYNPETASDFLIYFRSVRHTICNKFSLVSHKIKYVIGLIHDDDA